MALTKIEHDEILKKIAESGGATDDMLELIKKLRDDYDEREGMFKKDDEGEKWEEKYNELKTKYIDRFFAAPNEKKDGEVIKREVKEDVKKDGEKLTFDELFEKKEG